jgi:TetR/AcrR family transcriptional regulator, regulator of autoinduction and epiphytic fitness
MSQTTNRAGDKRVARSRAAVLEAGVELLVEGGPNAVTVEAVVQRSGVAKTTIYRQWSSRDELVADVIGEVARAVPAPPPDMPFEPALRMLMRASCDQAGDDRLRRAFPALLLAKAQGQPELDRLRAGAQDEQQARLEDLLRRGVAEGHLGPDVTLEDALLQLLAPLILITCDLHDFDDDVADRIVDLFLASHRPDG